MFGPRRSRSHQLCFGVIRRVATFDLASKEKPIASKNIHVAGTAYSYNNSIISWILNSFKHKIKEKILTRIINDLGSNTENENKAIKTST